jgi:hypothetical protein
MTRPESGEFRRPFSYPDFSDLQERSHSFDGMAAWALGRINFSSGEPELLHYGVVTSRFFSVLRMPPALGRDFRGEDDRAHLGKRIHVEAGMRCTCRSRSGPRAR